MSFFLDVLNPTIFIGELEIREPITSLTDFLTACVSGVSFFLFLFYKKNSKNKSFVFFKFYFLCYFIGMTSAAFLGHAFQAYLPKEVKIIGWVFSAMGQFFLSIATLKVMGNTISKKWISFFNLLLIVQLSVFIFLMIHPSYSDFKIAQIAGSSVLIGFILPMHIFNFLKTKSEGSKAIILAIVYALIPALVYNNQFSISRWFNYHDISHVLMSIFILLMFYASKKLSWK